MMTLPLLPQPPTFAAETPVLASQLRASVSDAVAFLTAVPRFAGQQTVTPQNIASGTSTQIALDTELLDNWNGHRTSTSSSNYYAQFRGWYLCEMTGPLNTTAGGTTQLGAAVGGVQNGGATTYYGGGYIAATSSFPYQAVAAKLMLMEQVGPFGTGDFIFAGISQVNGGNTTAPLFIGGAVPSLSCRWVSVITGTQPLAVPSNPAWPVPPSFITSAFGNANIRDAINFLVNPPIMEYCRTGGGGSVPSSATIPAVGTAVSMNSAVVDNYSAFSGSTWTAPVAGRYYCYGCVSIQAGANGVAAGAGLTVTSANYNGGTQITLWGGTTATLTSNFDAVVVRKRLRLNAGDTIQLAAVQNDSGGAAAAFASGLGVWIPRLIIVWESA